MAALTVFLPIFFGFVPTVKAAGGPSAPPPTTSSNPIPTQSDYWKICALKVVYPNAQGNGTDICSLTDTSSDGSASFIYGSSPANALTEAIYDTKYGANPPTTINLKNPDGVDDLTGGSSTQETLAWNNVGYTNSSYTVSGTLNGTPQSVKFYVFQPGLGAPNYKNYSLLVSINSDKSLHVLAMVYNVPTNNQVVAAPIDKVAVGITSSGALCTSASEASCGPASIYSATVNNPTSACVTQSNMGLEWLLCPLVDDFDKAADRINGLIETQLNFNVSQNLPDNGPVHFAWSIIKDIASSLVVLLLLVMVIAQAFGGGPFEAYTIRKMLPKLVVAVIAMQLSWDICKYLIDLANSVGQGVASILTLPFNNSPGALTLNGILTKLAPSNFQAAQAALPITFIILGFIGLVALPTTMVLLFSLLVGVFAALMVLLFRNVLIVALVLFSSLAFLAWTMNGTQNLWKTWRSNFGKLLMLFPVVISIIYVGRIFAWIAAGASGDSIIKWITVVIAYFGPYFIIFKAYKWGGGLLSAAGNGINNASNRINKGSEQTIRGIGERYQGKRAKMYDPNAGLGSRTLRRIQSGHVIPFSKRSQRLAIAAGDKWQNERDEEALALINRKGEGARRDGYDITRRDKQGRVQKYKLENGHMVDKQGRVTTDADKAVTEDANPGDQLATKHLTGVAAMKQMWVDLAEDGRDVHEKKMAVRQLLATSSWPEIQGSFTRSGKKVFDTDIWNPAVTGSPEDYPKVLRSRVDATPHILDSADKALVSKNAELRQSGKASLSELDAREFKAAYRMNYALDKQMSNEDFATQSDGFWEEAARLASLRDPVTGQLTEEARSIRRNLRARLKSIHDIGGTAPQQLLGHLQNGGDLQTSVETALGVSKGRLSAYTDPRTEVLENYPVVIDEKVEPVTTAERASQIYTAGNPAGGSRTRRVTRENLHNMSEENAIDWVRSQEGYQSLSNEDLVALYNSRSRLPGSAVQQAARQELRRRGVLNPEDSTTLNIPHSENIVLPGERGFEPPDSSQLPGGPNFNNPNRPGGAR